MTIRAAVQAKSLNGAGIALVYALAITLAEVFTVLIQPAVGVLFHVAILVAVIAHSALTKEPAHQRLFLSLSLAPLTRILSLSMPLASVPRIWWFPIIYTPLFVATLVVIRVLGYRREQVGLVSGRLPVQLLVVSLGPFLGVLEHLILREEALVPELTAQAIWLPAVIFVATTGFVEELIFRGVLQRSAGAVFGEWRGIIYCSFIFSILHIGFLSWVDVVFVFSAAMLFGWIVKKTGSILGVTIAHGITNIILYLVAPFTF